MTALLLGAITTACAEAEAEPALRVGHVRFTDEQVEGLTEEQRALLADLAAFGQLVAGGDEDSLAVPLAEREAHLSRLRALPYAVAVDAARIGDDSLRVLYSDAPEWELSVRHVVRLASAGASAAERDAALERAREAERRAQAGEDFAAIAAELSEEPGAAARGGLLEPGRRGSWVEPFWDAAVALRPGEVSPIVETRFGYHVLRLEDRRPVPFEEAARLPLLRRAIGPAEAMRAMEAWASARPPVPLDPPAVLTAREALRRGAALDTLLLARSHAGYPYAGRELALAWAALEPSERQSLAGADDARFGRWVEDEVRRRFWADDAARLGAERAPEILDRAAMEWRGRLARFAEAAGFGAGLEPDAIGAAALAALHARGQEALIARAELPGLRPLLRSFYPAERRE